MVFKNIYFTKYVSFVKKKKKHVMDGQEFLRKTSFRKNRFCYILR